MKSVIDKITLALLPWLSQIGLYLPRLLEVAKFPPRTGSGRQVPISVARAGWISLDDESLISRLARGEPWDSTPTSELTGRRSAAARS